MDLQQYQPYWDKAKPAMIAKLAEIESAMSAALTVAGFQFDVEVYEQGDEEFKMCRLIQDADGDVIASLEFTLFDADVNGEDGEAGVGVGLDLAGFNAQPLVGYFPGRYTEDAFTASEDEMLDRINGLNAAGFAEDAVESLSDETLVAEFKRDKK